MQKIFNESGVVRLFPLLFTVVAVGIISFLLISSTAPIGGLFGVLNPKPKTNAQQMEMMTLQDDCKFFTDSPGTPIAFCDTFDVAHSGGRNGDLDDSRWQYSRTNVNADNPPGEADGFGSVDVNRCQSVVPHVLPDNESFICGLDQPMPESNHWMEAIADGGAVVNDAGIIKQPFDFTNRTGVITYDTDAKTAGNHTWWPEVCVVDKLYGANEEGPNHPQNGFCVNMGETTDILSNITNLTQQPIAHGGVDVIHVFRDWGNYGLSPVHDDGNQGTSRYVTQPDHANHFEIRVSKNSIEVWASDKTDDGVNFPNFRRRYYITQMKANTNPNDPTTVPLNLPITKGYVWFGQGHYNAAKEGVVDEVTYHWHGIGFDGPTLSTVRGYDLSDSHDATNQPATSSGYSLGYVVNGSGVLPTPAGPPLIFKGVNVTGVTSGYISANIWNTNFTCCGTMMYRFNGGTWHSYTYDPNQINFFNTSGANIGSPAAIAMPVTISELKTGDNTVEFKTDGTTLDLANISLDLEPGDVLPLESQHIMIGMPSMTPLPSTTTIPTGSVMPTSTPESSGTESAFNGPHNLPGTLQVEDYDNGGESVGYHDLSAGNNGAIYRSDGVDIQQTGDTNGGFNVGWTESGEWMKYMVNVTNSGIYTLGFRVASPGVGGTFHLEVDGTDVTGSMTVPDTGGWQTYTTLNKTNVSLSTGQHVLKLVMDSTGSSSVTGNFNFLTFTQTSSNAPTATPSSCLKASLGDLDCDGTIGIFDFNILIGNFGKIGTGIQGDIDGSGKVDIFDYNILVGNFGK